MKLPLFAALAALFLLDAPHVIRAQTPPAPRPRRQFPELQLRDIEAMTPHARLRQAVKNGDLRFLGVNGFSLDVPGVSGDVSNPLVQLKGYNTIEETRDGLRTIKEWNRQNTAVRFATQYNRLLLTHLKAVSDADYRRVVIEIDGELLKLERANPESDARKAIKAGNAPVIEVAGGGFPGTVNIYGNGTREFPIFTLKAMDDLTTMSQKIRLKKW